MPTISGNIIESNVIHIDQQGIKYGTASELQFGNTYNMTVDSNISTNTPDNISNCYNITIVIYQINNNTLSDFFSLSDTDITITNTKNQNLYSNNSHYTQDFYLIIACNEQFDINSDYTVVINHNNYILSFIFNIVFPIDSSNNYIYIKSGTFTYPYPDCFKKNTLILTPTGYTQVENLRNCDYVLSSKNIPVKIKQMSSFISSGSEKDLYVLEKSIIKENVPFMDLYMSNNHAYKSDDKWHHMWCRSSLAKIVESNNNDVIEYYHILIDDYFSHNLVANGVEVETHYCEYMNIKKRDWNCNKNECVMKISDNNFINTELSSKISNKKIILA